MITGEQQYLAHLRYVYENGTDIINERTGKICRQVINADFVYNCTDGQFHMVTTRKISANALIAEMLGYLKGYTNAAQFRKLGTKSWDANANKNTSWLNNPHRKGKDDLGIIYGAVARDWPSESGTVDLIRTVYNDLRNGRDNRGEIITFWNPSTFDKGALRPCMYTHTFSLVGNVLHLTSYQRSHDIVLGGAWNMSQCCFLLHLMAHITGNKAGKVYHKIVNSHIYEDQLELVPKQLERSPLSVPTIEIDPSIETLDDVYDWVKPEHFIIRNYQHHCTIRYPMSA
jgi:thymidylate synthase